MNNDRVRLRGQRPFLAFAGAAIVLSVGASASFAATSRTTSIRDSGSLTGAGSTLIYPMISQWAPDFHNKTGISVAYGAIGSGGGIAQITARIVDFGASDAPMSPSQSAAANGVLQVPWALAATLVSYNLPGVKNIHLSGLVLSRIYLGRIKYWDDPLIKLLNPGVKLPHVAITPVYRSDGSGDTYVFTDFLSQTSPNWRQDVGNSTQVNFRVGVGAKGNDGVAGVVEKTPGALGYLAISYVKQNHLAYALVRNAANKYVLPTIKAISAAASSVTNIPASNAISIVNPPANYPTAYPMSTFTYALVPQHSSKAAQIKQFLNYAITTGQQFGPALLFAPLPARILSLDKVTIAKISS
jgi:phosphate transport system substrate-binding protein